MYYVIIICIYSITLCVTLPLLLIIQIPILFVIQLPVTHVILNVTTGKSWHEKICYANVP